MSFQEPARSCFCAGDTFALCYICSSVVSSVVSSVLLEITIPNEAQTLPGTYEYFSLPMQSFFAERWVFSALSKVEQAAQTVSIDLTKGSYKGGIKRGVG